MQCSALHCTALHCTALQWAQVRLAAGLKVKRLAVPFQGEATLSRGGHTVGGRVGSAVAIKSKL